MVKAVDNQGIQNNYMRGIAKEILRGGFRFALRHGPVELTSYIYARLVKKWRSLESCKHTKGPPLITVLALSPEIFRGDLDVLTCSGRVLILYLPHKWQRRLFLTFYSSGTKTMKIHRPELDDKTVVEQEEYHKFLHKFLPALYKKLDINLVIGANIRTEPDIDIGHVSKHCGFPYVVMHREALLTSPSIYKAVRDRHRSWGHFKGSHIIVQNRICRENFIESGYVTEDNISTAGCLRMDNFVTAAANLEIKKKKRITLFSFITTQSSIQYPFQVFQDAHVAVARFALRHPEIEVIIKPKSEHMIKSVWNQSWEKAMSNAGIESEGIANLKIRQNANPHELILSSQLVMAINSTTVLEASIVDIPVIVPAFKYIRTEEYHERTRFADYLDLFEVPDDQDSLLEMIERLYHCPDVDPDVLSCRRVLFEKFVSPLSSTALPQHLELFEKVIQEARRTGQDSNIHS